METPYGESQNVQKSIGDILAEVMIPWDNGIVTARDMKPREFVQWVLNKCNNKPTSTGLQEVLMAANASIFGIADERARLEMLRKMDRVGLLTPDQSEKLWQNR